MQFCTLAHFYPGFTYEVVADMEPEVRDMYWKGVTVIEARNTLMQMKIASYPHFKNEDDKEDFHRSMHKLAYPVLHSEVISLGELAKRLGAQVNG